MSLLFRETVKECSSSVTVLIRLVWIIASVQGNSIYRSKVHCPAGFTKGTPGFCYQLTYYQGQFQQILNNCRHTHPNASLALAVDRDAHRIYCNLVHQQEEMSDFVWLGAVQINSSKEYYKSVRTNKNFERNYFTLWGPDEPNYDSQLCIGMERDDCTHYDLECTRLLRGICEVIYTDLCEQQNHGCKQLCISRGVNDTYCDCRPGYRKEGQKNCVDIDECATDNGGCIKKCNNFDGGFNCFQNCSEGFQINEESGECEDVNECKHVNGFCHHKCINKENGEGFYCDCLKGFALLQNGTCATNTDASKQSEGNKGTFYWLSGVFVVLGMIGSAGIAFKTVQDVNAIENQLISKDNNDDEKPQGDDYKLDTLEENNEGGTAEDEKPHEDEDEHETREENNDGGTGRASEQDHNLARKSGVSRHSYV